MRAPIPRYRVTDLNVLPVAVDLGNYHAEVLSWGFIEPRVWRNYLHTHSFFEICAAFAGRGTFHMLRADYPVQAGDLFVAKPGEPHEIVSSIDDPLGIDFWSYTLLRRPDSADAPAVQSTTAVDALLDAFLTTRQWVSTQAPAVEPTLVLLTEEIFSIVLATLRPSRGLWPSCCWIPPAPWSTPP